MFSKTLYAYLAVIAAVTPQALATIFVTAPIATTVCSAGQPCAVTWNDNGVAPALASIGPCSIGVYAGSVTQQTLLQTISPSLDVSTTGSVSFNPDPTIGPNTNIYFIKFISIGLKDPSNPVAPYEQFSAKFTLQGMTGQFNSTVASEVAAASAPPSSATSAPLSTTKLSTTTVKDTASASKSSTSATATKSSGASSMSVNGGVGLGVFGGVMAALALIV